MPRTLSPYEYNHLVRHGIDPSQIAEYGEKPVEYITGHVIFNSHDFLVTEDTLIPRIETEELVAIAVAEIKQLHQQTQAATLPLSVADVGTGCGAIAISIILELLSQKIPLNLSFLISDISSSALNIAEKNLLRLLPDFNPTSPGLFTLEDHQTNTQITLKIIESNVLETYPPSQFDLILANLPYIPTERITVLDDSVKAFEPHLALDGGDQGLDLIHLLLNQASAFLAPTGKIILEVDYTHTSPEITTDPRWKVEMVFDSFQRQRFAVVTHA